MKATEKFVNIDGKKVHFYESKIENAKDTLVLLHGKSFKAETWISINADSRINDMGVNFIAVDYPGWGLSEENNKFWPPTDKYENASLFIEKFSNELNLLKFSLLGASFSGPFIVAYAYKNPIRVNKLLFIGTVWSDDLSEYVKKIDKPSLIIYGSNDSVIPPEASHKYRDSLKNNKFYIVSGARHALYLDKPDEFFKLVGEFL